MIGALADSVEEVIDLEPDQIQPAPRIGTQIRTDFIKGMGKRETQFIMILDIDRVFSADDLAVGPGDADGGASRGEWPEPMTPSSRQRGASPPRDLSRLRRLIYENRAIMFERGKEDHAGGQAASGAWHELSIGSYREYCEYVFDGREHEAEELVHLIDVVTTNKTDFFRERLHFDFLAAQALPELTAASGGAGVLVWSAGCSTRRGTLHPGDGFE